MFEPKTNFYYPGEDVVDPDAGIGEAVVPGEGAGEAVFPGTGDAGTPTATSSLPEPKTRKEYYLAAIAGEDVTIPEPKTRQEYFLKEIAENGGCSGGGGIFAVTTEAGDEPGTFANANHNATEIIAALSRNQLPVLFINGNDNPIPNIADYLSSAANPFTGGSFSLFTVKNSDGVVIRVNSDYTVEIKNKPK